jgi:hypothetical protein
MVRVQTRSGARSRPRRSGAAARRARRVVVSLVPLALTAIAAGCGGTSYTKRDFIARADAICASAVRQARALAPQSGLAATAGAVLPVVESEAAQLRALRRPGGSAGDRAALDRYYAALGQAVQNYRDLAGAAKRGDTQGATTAEAALRANPISSLASSYGLRSCGAPGATSA